MSFSLQVYRRTGCEKMKKRILRNRKAVSTVVGTILMILVVMTGMSILFGALIVYSDNFHSGSGSSVLESLTIEDMQFSPTQVQISIYNTGKVNFTVTSVYINGILAGQSQTYLPLNEGGHGVISVTGAFVQGASYSFKIVTSRGTGFEGIYIW
jgi:FlaG/FlaF family flagellin (archaellin)